MRIFGMRVEAELQRMDSERERETMIARLAHALGRLGHQHQLTRRANAFKTEALSMVAHDLRSPLAAIINRTEFIGALLDKNIMGSGANSATTTLREKLNTSCEAIGRSAHRMEHMIAKLLGAARAQARTIPLRCTEIDLSNRTRGDGLNQRPAASISDHRRVRQGPYIIGTKSGHRGVDNREQRREVFGTRRDDHRGNRHRY